MILLFSKFIPEMCDYGESLPMVTTL